MCLEENTRIRTLDGEHLTIKELSEKEEKVWIWVRDGDKIIPYHANPPVKTTTSKKWLKITFDNDTILECTEDHKIMINSPNKDDERVIWKIQENGYKIPYIKAKYLTPNDSICHVDFGICKMANSNTEEYEIFSFNNMKHDFTHRYVWKYFAEDCDVDRYKDGLHDIHHEDENSKNNIPDNLYMLRKGEHLAHHFDPEKHAKIISEHHEKGTYKGTSFFIEYNKTQEHSDNIKQKHAEGVYDEIYKNLIENSQILKRTLRNAIIIYTPVILLFLNQIQE
jgi:intein/homing endonuclease